MSGQASESSNISNQQKIPLEIIQEYIDPNVPILPLDQNGIGDTTNLFTRQDLEQLPEPIKNFPGVFDTETDEKGKETRTLHPLKLLSRFNPKDFWTPERVGRQVWHGIGVLTGLTAIKSKNDPNKELLVIFIDADAAKTVILLDEFIKRNSLDRRTIVQKSAHGKRHLLFSVAVDPNDKEELELWRKRALLHSTRLFTDNENVIEIKTQSNQATLAPSKHRTDKTLEYVNTSGIKSISEEEPIVYEALIKEIKDRGCIPCTPEEHNNRREQQDSAESARFFQATKDRKEENRQDFTEAEMENGFKIITGADEENQREGRPFGSIYEKGFRQGVVMALSGCNFFNNVTEEYAVKLVERLARYNSLSNSDIKKACDLARNTYKRGRKGECIVARNSLIEDFKRVHKDHDENAARQRYEKLRIALGYKNKIPKERSRPSNVTEVKQADILVNIARKEVPLFFKNQFHEYCAVVRVNIENEVVGKRNHYEVVKLDEYAFKSALRHLWIQENIAQNNPAKVTIGEDQLKQAVESLKHDVDYNGIPPIETHLRVAWKEVERVYRYDKCDPDWHQVEVRSSIDGKSSVEEITSDIMIKEINEWKTSKFDKSKTPIFFRRYDVNEEQDTPDLDFHDNGPEDNIFEEFIQDLTNVTGNKSSERAREQVHHFRTEASLSARKKSLLAKVNTLTKFVPDITHFVTCVLGPDGSMKTSFLRCEKDLVDPIVGWELYSPRMNLKEIVLVFAHSWFVAYDNIGKVSDDFINFVCSSTTGTSQDFRKLYNDDVMLRVVIKNVVSIACINRVLNANDILRRSLNEGFIDAKDGGHYQEDSDIKAQFKAMKPKILGYIFSTFSKAIEIKRKMKKGYVLGSMASPEKWGEAFAQAMGYQEGEFIKAYEELDAIQQGLKLDYNPLVVVYQRLYYDLFVKQHSDIPLDQLSEQEREQRLSELEARRLGYKEYNYVKLNEALLSYTEYEGIKTTGKDSRWPKNNAELKDRTLVIAADLSRSKPFGVIVRKDSKNHNEIKYVIGTNAGLNHYRQLYPLTSNDGHDNANSNFISISGDGKDEGIRNQEATYYECISLLQQSNSGEKIENILKLVSHRNPNADLYLGHRFKVEESRNVQTILRLLLNHPRIEPVSRHPWTLRWIPNGEYVDPVLSDAIPKDKSNGLQSTSDSNNQKALSIINQGQNVSESVNNRIEQSSADSLLTGVLQNQDHFSESNALASESLKIKPVQTDLENSFSKSAGGILFGIAFWIVTRNVGRTIVKDYMVISAYGLVLLFTSNQASILATGPYPPFGLATASFLGLSSYLVLVGIYSSVISVSEDSRLRQSIRDFAIKEAKLLDSIGTAQMEQELTNRVISFAKVHSNSMREETAIEPSIQEDDMKQYLEQVIREVKERTTNNR